MTTSALTTIALTTSALTTSAWTTSALILMSEVSKHLYGLAKTWLDKDNYKFICNDNSRSFSCCSESQNNDLRLQSMIEDSLNFDDNIQAETYNQIVNSKFLTETLWTRKAGDSVPLEPQHRAAMHAVHLFANAEHVPVRTYDFEDTAAALNEASLWETCTSRVAGLFATLPFTTEAVAQERKLRGRTVHAPPGAFADFDPSIDYAEDHVHSMELLVDAVLERSRASAPPLLDTRTSTWPRTACGASAQTRRWQSRLPRRRRRG